jgi:N-acetylglucosamine malate deacetylase 2
MIRELIRRLKWHRSVNGDGGLLKALAAGESVAVPVTVIVAHPDDELIGMGSRLSRLENLTLVYATDGAPSNMRHARALGFDSAEAYSRARYDESRAALAIAGANPVRQKVLGFSDGDTVFHLLALVERVAQTITGAAAVITHAYEGGHPDHDSCALAVQLACSEISARGQKPPLRLEFAGYYSHGGQLVTNSFWPAADVREAVVRLSWREQRTKRKAMRAFATQSIIIKKYPPAREAYRGAPVYDFFRPPPPGEWYYDCYNWPLKGKDWLAQVRARLDAEFRVAASDAAS